MSKPKSDYTKMVFINPMNSYQETISNHAIPATFFFGFIYLAYKGCWNEAFVLLIITAPFGLIGWLGLIFVAILNFIFAFGVETTLAKQYLRKGWKMLPIASPNNDPVHPTQ